LPLPFFWLAPTAQVAAKLNNLDYGAIETCGVFAISFLGLATHKTMKFSQRPHDRQDGAADSPSPSR
jgi:hypothetical protein